MKTTSLLLPFSSLLLFVGGPLAATAQDYDWTLDPRPYAERTTRLYEIGVHRYVPEAGTGTVWERRYLLTASGLLAKIGDFAVPATATIPEEAFNKLLVPASAWLAYRRLGPKALENFELVTEVPIVVSNASWHYEVAVAEGARGNVGAVPNLSARGEVTSTAPLQGGFVVEGVSRTVLIRAVGPGLRAFGLERPVSASRLQLFRQGNVLLTNDDWATTPSHRMMVQAATARTGAFPLEPGVRDAATVITLAPGAYTVHASAVLGGGTILLEVYLLD